MFSEISNFPSIWDVTTASENVVSFNFFSLVRHMRRFKEWEPLVENNFFFSRKSTKNTEPFFSTKVAHKKQNTQWKAKKKGQERKAEQIVGGLRKERMENKINVSLRVLWRYLIIATCLQEYSHRGFYHKTRTHRNPIYFSVIPMSWLTIRTTVTLKNCNHNYQRAMKTTSCPLISQDVYFVNSISHLH